MSGRPCPEGCLCGRHAFSRPGAAPQPVVIDRAWQHRRTTTELTGRLQRPVTQASRIVTPLATDWPHEFGKLKRSTGQWGPVSSWGVAEIPCEMVLTMNPGTNGREMIVRCRCMAGTVHEPPRHFYNYDPLGVVPAAEAAALWRKHRDERAAKADVA